MGSPHAQQKRSKKWDTGFVYGGTLNHTVIPGLGRKGLMGNVAEKTLKSVAILTNKNIIPCDLKKPKVGKGLRLDSSALSPRGMGNGESAKLLY